MALSVHPIFLPLLASTLAAGGTGPGPVQGDTLSRVRLPPGHVATVLCTGINGADGLALSSEGELYAAAETEGALYRIDLSGSAETVVRDLDHPEGVAVDTTTGTVYVTEDTEHGRLLALRSDGNVTVIGDSLQYPEGVAVSGNGSVFVTESSAETGRLPPFLTGVRRLGENGSSVVYSSLYLWSFSDLLADSAGTLYLCNETSGILFVTGSVIRVNPSTGEGEVFAAGLSRCEGICSTPGSFFPLYVAEEDLGEGRGRISAVHRDGSVSVVAEGFYNVEDVAVDGSGRIFVSEDTTGMIIMILPPRGP
ncbi:MAG: hypothetical protein R6U39_09605 [Candidatus Aegiribacteria sp.]